MINEIKDGIEILKLNKPIMAAVAGRTSAKKWGFIILAAPCVLNLILSSMLSPSAFGSIFTANLFWPLIIPSLALLGSIFAMSYGAEKFFQSSHNHWAFFKVLSYSSVFLFLTVVPFLLSLIGFLRNPYPLFGLATLAGSVWVLVVAYHLFLEWGKISKQNTLIIVVIGFFALLFLDRILGSSLVGSYYLGLWGAL